MSRLTLIHKPGTGRLSVTPSACVPVIVFNNAWITVHLPDLHTNCVRYIAGAVVIRTLDGVARRLSRHRSYTILADRAFHFELDEAIELNRILHGQLLHERIEEAVHDHGARFLFVHAAGREIIQLLLGDL